MNYHFNQYTHLKKTPSSMAWLLRQRSHMLGLIEYKTDQRITLLAEIEDLRRQLSAVDRVIRLHEVPVEPEEVRGRRTIRKSLVGRGQMSRFILEQFREAGGQPLATTEIAIRFLKSIDQPMTMSNLKDVRTRIRYRLKNLARDGTIEPLHQPDVDGVFKVEGVWTMKTTDACD